VKRVLVTGGSGFIGRHLCRRLHAEEVDVHTVSRRALEADGVTSWCADLTDRAAVGEVFERVRPDGVFHLASIVSGARGLDAVMPTLEGNLLTAVSVLEAAVEHQCDRVVLAGSMEEPEPSSHGAELVPVSPYAAAKLGATTYGSMFHALYGLATVTVRLFMVYGPGQDDWAKLVPYTITSLLRGEPPQLMSGARPVDWIYVDDAVDGLLAAARATGVAGLAVDVGSGELVDVRSVVEMIAELVHAGVDPVFDGIPDRPRERVRTADVDRTQQLIGWSPTMPLRAGLEQTVAWYRGELANKHAAETMP
jgi:UDP-glucose 4-epimerase